MGPDGGGGGGGGTVESCRVLPGIGNGWARCPSIVCPSPTVAS